MVLFIWDQSIMVLSRYFFYVLFLLSPSLAADEPDDLQESTVRIIALFENAAMIDFKGKQKIYRIGQQISPEIKLIKANTRLATLLIKQEKIELGLANSTSVKLQPDKPVPDKPEIEKNNKTKKLARVVRDNSGMFKTSGFINGVAVPFLVDTGATTIAMNEDYAKLVGLSYRLDGRKGHGQTASGVVSTWHVTLNKVQVGGIVLTNVDAAVIKGKFPQEVLLGMSFLNRINVDYDGPLLTLTKKY